MGKTSLVVNVLKTDNNLYNKPKHGLYAMA